MTPWRTYAHPDTGQVVHDFGWIRDPVRVQEFLATLERPYFEDAAVHLMQATDPNQNALLWEACKKVTGDNLPAHNQKDVGCHSEQTEVLTEDGWVRWPDYDWRRLLGTMNPATGMLEFQAPLAKIVYEYDGPLYHVDHNSLDFALTPNHRMYQRRWDERQRTLSSSYQFKNVEDLGWYCGLPHATRGFQGVELKRLSVGGWDFTGNDFLALIALVLSDGWVGGTEHTQDRISFCCFRQDRRAMVAALANRLGFLEQPSHKGVWVKTAPGVAAWFRANAFTKPVYRSPHKRIPDLVRTVTGLQIEHFLRFFGDQHVQEGRRQFYSSSSRLIDDLQELLLRIGKRGGIYTRKQRPSVTKDGRSINPDANGEDITLSEWTTDNLSITRKKQLHTEDYHGQVFCATVPNGTLVTRLNGSVLVSGNCCVSEGWSSGLEYATCVEVALGKPLEYKTVSHSAVYGLAREVGGYLGSGDGSTGSDAAKAVSTYGVCSCDEAGDRNDDPAFARAWGRSGVPQPIKDKCKPHLAQVSLVTTADQAKTALQNGYPVPIASDQGFSMTRDNDGYCRAQGSWNHEMCLIGYRADSNRFCILQSWGAGTPSGPTSLGQPDCSFWADYQVVNRMLGQRDSYAISVYAGYESRVLNWLI